MSRSHVCVGGERVERPAQNVYDGQGIFLCRAEKLRPFRSKILTDYTQDDVNEPIEPVA